MNISNLKHRLLLALSGTLAVFGLWTFLSPTPVKAESGTVYSCTVNRSYSHPVTGVVEDSGGESSYATGQGMVEGCVYGSGLMEVTDSGNYYLTVRLGLMDYTSGHSFSVQSTGDSGWSQASTAITGTGSDNNGSTADLCIQVPSTDCIVRGSMYVEPMGRDVIFYFYPSDYQEGNSIGMTPAFVTETSSGDASALSDSGSALSDGSSGTTSGTVASDSSGTTSGNNGTASGNTGTTAGSNGTVSGSTVSGNSASGTQSDISDSSNLDSAQGLSLSTADESAVTSTDSSGSLSGTAGSIFVLVVSITIAGLILIAVAALIVWYFRKNWRRWGGEDDDYDDDYDD